MAIFHSKWTISEPIHFGKIAALGCPNDDFFRILKLSTAISNFFEPFFCPPRPTRNGIESQKKGTSNDIAPEIKRLDRNHVGNSSLLEATSIALCADPFDQTGTPALNSKSPRPRMRAAGGEPASRKIN